MGKHTKEIVVKGVIFFLVPAFCTYLGQNDNMLDWLQGNGYIGAEVNLELVRQCASILSIIITFALLTVPLIVSNLHGSAYKTQRDILIKNNKEIFQTTLKNNWDWNTANLILGYLCHVCQLSKEYVYG